MNAIYKKELHNYFTSIAAYLFIAFYMALTGFCITNNSIFRGYSNFAYPLSATTTIFIMLMPILTMRILAEEKHQRTDQMLLTSPVSITRMVLGKFFAMVTVLLVGILVVCVYPVILKQYGNVNLKAAYGCIIAFFLFAITYMSIGMFISALTESQAIAAIATFAVAIITALVSSFRDSVPAGGAPGFYFTVIAFGVIVVILYFLLKNITFCVLLGAAGEAGLFLLYKKQATAYDGLVGRVIDSISIIDRFYDFVYEQFSVASAVYYISITALFVFLTIQVVNKRRWS